MNSVISKSKPFHEPLMLLICWVVLVLFVTPQVMAAAKGNKGENEDEESTSLQINQAEVDLKNGRIILYGENFGHNPVVTVGDTWLYVIYASDRRLEAELWSDNPQPGTYKIWVAAEPDDLSGSMKNKSKIDVTIGSMGPKGPKGLEGLQGPTGSKGGPPRHQWDGSRLMFENPDGTWDEPVDLMGPQGKTGSQGPAGPQGPEGKKGDPGECHCEYSFDITNVGENLFIPAKSSRTTSLFCPATYKAVSSQWRVYGQHANPVTINHSEAIHRAYLNDGWQISIHNSNAHNVRFHWSVNCMRISHEATHESGD